MSDYVIGIDLGTTNTCTAIFLDGKVKFVENAEGDRVTPSFVYFIDITRDKFIAGSFAKKMTAQKPELGVYGFKTLIGCDYSAISVEKDQKHYSFVLTQNSSGKVAIKLEDKGTTLVPTPQEVTSMLLKKIKKDVCSKLGEDVDKAVITVPAYFEMESREATVEAAKKAGFKVVKLLNESTAVALNFFHEKKPAEPNCYYLVYDLGGGTFNIAILKRNDNGVETVAVEGDHHLGGKNFDSLILDYILAWLKRNNFKVSNDKRTMRRLLIKSEQAKKHLSYAKETEIILKGFVAGHDIISIPLTRQKFEIMAAPLFKNTIYTIDYCLRYNTIDRSLITEIILSGGSTRIPKIQSMISEYFVSKPLYKFVNPDECVAEGAAIQAAILSAHPEQRIDNVLTKEVIPLSLGIATRSSRMKFVIMRDTVIPAQGEIKCATTKNNQIRLPINIYEGDRTDARRNRHLGKMILTDLTPLPPGQCKITVHLKVDLNGILTVRAEEKHTDNVKELKIEYTRGIRSDSDIVNTLLQTETNKSADEWFLQFAKHKQYLLHYCTQCRYNLEEKQLVSTHQDLYDKCLQTMKTAKYVEMEIYHMIDEMESLMGPIIEQYNFKYIPKKPVYIDTTDDDDDDDDDMYDDDFYSD